MGSEQIRRWESGALAHAVTDPFGQGPVPWLRGDEQYFDDTGHVVPWYIDHAPGATQLHDTGRDRKAGTKGAIPHPRAGGPRSADDVHRQIKGFTSTGAAAPGEAIDFHITVDPPQEFSVDIYRIGHYGGDGASKITTSPRLSGIVQPPPLTADRTVSCHHWWLSWRLQIPSYWNIGAYVAVLTTVDGYRSHVPFTVRDDHPADLLLLLPDITWQAYNLYPEDGHTGASLYHAWDENGRLLGEADAATTVSFDRPYAGAGLPSTWATPTISSAGPSATATTSPTPTPATCTPAGSTPPATGAWSSRATTSTGRRRCAAPRSSPASTAPRSSSSPPTPCTGKWSWARPRPASPTACSPASSAGAPENRPCGVKSTARNSNSSASSTRAESPTPTPGRPQRRPLALGGDRRTRG